MTQGYQALREAAAWFDLSSRGRIRVRGTDRVRLLHAMTTNHVQQLTAGEGCYAFALNATGHILADLYILCKVDCLLLDTEPETRLLLFEHIKRHIIADDVALEDITGESVAVGVEGPTAATVLASLGAPLPKAMNSHVEWGSRMVARLSCTGAPGFRILAPQSEGVELTRQIESSGLPTVGPEELRVVRLEHGRPRYAEDITEKHLPQETQLMHAVHFDKGCYLGQEIVERIRSRGHVNRFLVPLEISSSSAPDPGTRILSGDRDVGEITSAAFSPAMNKTVVLAYLRADVVRAPTALTVGGETAELRTTGLL